MMNPEVEEKFFSMLSSALAEEGMMLEGFIGFYNYMNTEGHRCWEIMAPPRQHNDSSLAMAEHLAAFYRERRKVQIQEVLFS